MAPSFWQILIVLLIVLLIFGTRRLRNIGSDVGGAVKGFRDAMREGEQREVEHKSADETQASDRDKNA